MSGRPIVAVTCPKCRGRGWVDWRDNYYDGGFVTAEAPNVVTETCDRCLGVGEVPAFGVTEDE